VPLHGAHQGDNASWPWPRWRRSSGRPLDEDVVEEAFASVRVPGRLEVIGRRPLVVVDGAHNVAGMLVLARSLAEEFTVDGEGQAVVGMLSGRDPVHARGLAVRRHPIVVACAPDSPRALSAEVVADAAVGWGMEATVAATPRGGGLALGRAGPDDRVVVCGSLYVVADARRPCWSPTDSEPPSRSVLSVTAVLSARSVLSDTVGWVG
jgi:dihydrofolate synthase/folylpolyglutamate synthase